LVALVTWKACPVEALVPPMPLFEELMEPVWPVVLAAPVVSAVALPAVVPLPPVAAEPRSCPVTWISFPTNMRKASLLPVKVYLAPVLSSVRIKVPLEADPERHPFKVLPVDEVPACAVVPV
jgi:hypothetical protein